MVVTQVAFSLVLLVGALLFVRSFRNLITFDPGMREVGITVAILAYQQAHIARIIMRTFSANCWMRSAPRRE
jgi:putative ABC transport system permease protein